MELTFNTVAHDWPAMKQAIKELNEYYKEKNMKSDRENTSMKEDRYEFPASEWSIEYGTFPTNYILTRKKPRVEEPEKAPVKVEWKNALLVVYGSSCRASGYGVDYGTFHVVQFRVTGWDAEESYEYYDSGYSLLSLCRTTPESSYHNLFMRKDLYIGLDARDKWSTPVLLPESIYEKLPEICRALEDRANEVKG